MDLQGSGKTLAFGIPLLHHILRYHQVEGEKQYREKEKKGEHVNFRQVKEGDYCYTQNSCC